MSLSHVLRDGFSFVISLSEFSFIRVGFSFMADTRFLYRKGLYFYCMWVSIKMVRLSFKIWLKVERATDRAYESIQTWLLDIYSIFDIYLIALDVS